MISIRKYCTVDFLAKHLYVAPITVRRDLADLEAAGLLTRCYGGASIPEHQNREVPFDLRDRTNATVKAELGKRAAAMLKNGDTVFLDASSTARHIIDYMEPEQNLTVITNSMKAMEKLKEKHIRCYLTGGMLLENSFALIGNIAEKTVSELYADVFFFSTQGITRDGVITDFSEAETRLRCLMMEHAKHSVYVFDSSKLGKSFLFKVCSVSDVDDIVTDAEVEFSTN
ncbi:MAG: DeoR/GlpR transcriptional regulator [Lachnospiraceae bacterium]|nr:DeoR/GlpR transcriptional regulator [Lachnospiraceae bacterium]